MGNASSSSTDQPQDQTNINQTPVATVAENDDATSSTPVAIATPVDDKSAETVDGETGVTLSMSTEYSIYSTEATETLLGVNLRAPAAPNDTDRAPVDCVVVSDVSGSMSGSKMTLLKETVHLLLDEFVSKDRVGLVTFDSNVHEKFPLQTLDGDARAKATGVVDQYRAGSATNLSGGCFAGIQQLLNSSNKGHVKTVLLMTDGQANNGLRTADEMIPVLTNMLKDSGISLHTFGYGADHDSDFLRKISTAGNGSYYFVEGVDDIRSAFGDCLGGMLSVVAQNLQVDLEPLNGTTITKVHHKNAVSIDGGKLFRVPFADLYGEEQRDVIVSVKLKSSSVVKESTLPEGQLLRATLRYIDVLAAKPTTSSVTVGACRATKVDVKDQVQNQKLSLQSTRLKVAETLETAKATAEKGDLKKARSLIEATRDEVRSMKSKCAGSAEADEMLPVFEDDLRECADGLVDQQSYRNVSHKMAYLAEGHMQQRCMESTVQASLFSSDDGYAACMAAPPTKALRGNAYRTKAKSSKASKFSGF